MLYEYKNEYYIKQAPRHIVLGDIQVFNPTDEQLEQLGYKRLVDSLKPIQEGVEGYSLEPRYINHDDYILRSWVYVPIEEENE